MKKILILGALTCLTLAPGLMAMEEVSPPQPSTVGNIFLGLKEEGVYAAKALVPPIGASILFGSFAQRRTPEPLVDMCSNFLGKGATSLVEHTPFDSGKLTTSSKKSLSNAISGNISILLASSCYNFGNSVYSSALPNLAKTRATDKLWKVLAILTACKTAQQLYKKHQTRSGIKGCALDYANNRAYDHKDSRGDPSPIWTDYVAGYTATAFSWLPKQSDSMFSQKNIVQNVVPALVASSVRSAVFSQNTIV